MPNADILRNCTRRLSRATAARSNSSLTICGEGEVCLPTLNAGSLSNDGRRTAKSGHDAYLNESGRYPLPPLFRGEFGAPLRESRPFEIFLIRSHPDVDAGGRTGGRRRGSTPCGERVSTRAAKAAVVAVLGHAVVHGHTGEIDATGAGDGTRLAIARSHGRRRSVGADAVGLWLNRAKGRRCDI